MFSLQHIHKSYNDEIVLDDINLSVNSGEVVALVGENGTGKTTLLQIIASEIKSDSGQVLLHNEVVGYIPQEMPLGKTIKESFSLDTEEWRIYAALDRVGLEKSFETPVKNLSGGQKTRLAFAKVLANNPSPTTLLLDEPTNNLDSEGLVWLKKFIRSFHGSVLLVSHDRMFINDIATGVAELDEGKIKYYGGNYDFYKEQKQIDKQTEVDEYYKRLEEKKHLERQFKSAQHRAKNGLMRKRNDNDKMAYDAHQDAVQKTFSGQTRAIKTKLLRFDNLQKPLIAKNFKFSFTGQVPESKLVLKLENVSFSYGDNDLLKNINLELRGNQRLRVVGKNGTGKTTLLKIAAGQLKPDSGMFTVGEEIKVGYFSQDVTGLDEQKTIIENFDSDTTKVRNLMHVLGISQNDIYKPIEQFSRGQKAKVGIVKLLLDGVQLLILDEPTNHLDIKTRDQIEAALQNYKGAVLLASHDEYFVRAIGGVNLTLPLQL